MLLFFLFLFFVGLIYGDEDEDADLDDPWEVLDE